MSVATYHGYTGAICNKELADCVKLFKDYDRDHTYDDLSVFNRLIVKTDYLRNSILPKLQSTLPLGQENPVSKLPEIDKGIARFTNLYEPKQQLDRLKLHQRTLQQMVRAAAPLENVHKKFADTLHQVRDIQHVIATRFKLQEPEARRYENASRAIETAVNDLSAVRQHALLTSLNKHFEQLDNLTRARGNSVDSVDIDRLVSLHASEVNKIKAEVECLNIPDNTRKVFDSTFRIIDRTINYIDESIISENREAGIRKLQFKINLEKEFLLNIDLTDYRSRYHNKDEFDKLNEDLVQSQARVRNIELKIRDLGLTPNSEEDQNFEALLSSWGDLARDVHNRLYFEPGCLKASRVAIYSEEAWKRTKAKYHSAAAKVSEKWDEWQARPGMGTAIMLGRVFTEIAYNYTIGQLPTRARIQSACTSVFTSCRRRPPPAPPAVVAAPIPVPDPAAAVAVVAAPIPVPDPAVAVAAAAIPVPDPAAAVAVAAAAIPVPDPAAAAAAVAVAGAPPPVGGAQAPEGEPGDPQVADQAQVEAQVEGLGEGPRAGEQPGEQPPRRLLPAPEGFIERVFAYIEG